MLDGMLRRMRWVVAIVVVVSACGPVAYIHQVTINADDAVAAARRADAEKYSPYWWTRATQYLHMSREVAGHADYQAANRFGRLSEEAAIKAKEEAEIGAQDPSKLPYRDVTKKTAPAKDKVAPAKDDQVAPAKDPP